MRVADLAAGFDRLVAATRREFGRPTAPAARYARLFATWLAARTVVWVLVVVAVHPNAPLDVIELLGWGNAWQPGYMNHPPLPCWVAAAFGRLSPGDVWGVYVAGYLASAACVWAAWRVGREYLPPRLAFLAAVALDGLVYLTVDAVEWNNNVSLNIGWALTVAFAAAALRTGAVRWWLATGLAAAAALLCKYTAVFLFAPLAAYLVCSPRGRTHLRRPGPYLAAGVVLALFAPHAVWVAEHDFTTVRFAAERAEEARGAIRHLVNPAVFLVTQAALVAPILFVLWPLVGRSRPAPPPDRGPDRWFLRAVVIGPVGLFVLFGAATGCQLRNIWGATFWTFLGVWLLAECGRQDDPGAAGRATRRWVVAAALVLAGFCVKQTAGPHLDPGPTRAHFPGKPLAAEVNRRWGEQFDRPFGVAAGEAWAAGNIACYSAHRPTLYTNWSVGYLVFDPKRSPWTGDDDMNRRGGVIVWDADQLGDALHPSVRVRFPRAIDQPPVVLPYQTSAPVLPVRIGLAFVPPADGRD